MANIEVGKKGIVNTNQVNVREGTSTSNNRIYYAQKGDIVTCQEAKTVSAELWLKVTNETRYQSKIGWMMAKVLAGIQINILMMVLSKLHATARAVR